MKYQTAAALLREIRRRYGPRNLGCAYGCHDWRFDDPEPGLKRCAGPCSGVYTHRRGAYWQLP